VAGGWIFAMELIPGFSLFRGLYELAQYSFIAKYTNTSAMKFRNLSDKGNGMTTVWAIQIVEWALFLVLAWYLDQVVSSSSGVKKHPLFLFHKCCGRRSRGPAALAKSASTAGSGGKVHLEMEKPDVAQEVSLGLELINLDGQTRYIKTIYSALV
jgi:hypothetical protein